MSLKVIALYRTLSKVDIRTLYTLFNKYLGTYTESTGLPQRVVMKTGMIYESLEEKRDKQYHCQFFFMQTGTNKLQGF